MFTSIFSSYFVGRSCLLSVYVQEISRTDETSATGPIDDTGPAGDTRVKCETGVMGPRVVLF